MKENKRSEFLDSNGKTIFENDYIKIVRTKDNYTLAARERITFFNEKWEVQSLLTYERVPLINYINAVKEGRLEIYIVGNYLTEKF